jgi:hypothetical protein
MLVFIYNQDSNTLPHIANYQDSSENHQLTVYILIQKVLFVYRVRTTIYCILLHAATAASLVDLNGGA